MDDRERYKQLVGAYAADMVPSNSVIGLGTGSTATYFVTAVAERLRDGRLTNVIGVPTSERTAAQARRESAAQPHRHRARCADPRRHAGGRGREA